MISTGVAGRDVTPEAFRQVYDKEIEGFGELFRMLSYEKVKTSTIQSRATGGVAGGDRFAFDANSLDGRDVISDFTSGSGGDLIDLSDLLTAFDSAVNNINNFLRTSVEDGNTVLQVDQDGNAGGANFVDVATIQGVTTDVLGLLNNGSLVLAD